MLSRQLGRQLQCILLQQSHYSCQKNWFLLRLQKMNVKYCELRCFILINITFSPAYLVSQIWLLLQYLVPCHNCCVLHFPTTMSCMLFAQFCHGCDGCSPQQCDQQPNDYQDHKFIIVSFQLNKNKKMVKREWGDSGMKKIQINQIHAFPQFIMIKRKLRHFYVPDPTL